MADGELYLPDDLLSSKPSDQSSWITEVQKQEKHQDISGTIQSLNPILQVDMAQEVIHVRSRRGKAADSHSLAERLRREKINYKLRCLQELVPGCYKTMGMAVMLDEIINYVQSLQNQAEFLAMDLAVASSFYELNMEKEAIRNVQVIIQVTLKAQNT